MLKQPVVSCLCAALLLRVAAESVGSSPDELTAGLTESTHTTKTRGERLQPAARAAGEGTYVIAKGGRSNGVHLG